MSDYYQDSQPGGNPQYSNEAKNYVPASESTHPYPNLSVSCRRFTANLTSEEINVDALLSQVNFEHLSQGAIFKNVTSFLVQVEGNKSVVYELNYSRVVVLTQACDLKRNYDARKSASTGKHDKILLTALVAPIFDLTTAREGDHLAGFSMKMELIPTKKRESLKTHDIARYYQLNDKDFEDASDIGFQEGLVDFKHFFTVPLSQLNQGNYLTKLAQFHREKLSHRFSSFLSRVGIPEN